MNAREGGPVVKRASAFAWTLPRLLFVSLAAALIALGGAGKSSAATITRISVDSVGVQGNSLSSRPDITPDGRFVAFESFSSNLVSGDTNGVYDIFVRDLQTGMTERVSVGPGGVEGNGPSNMPAISDDGRIVAFFSTASNLVADDTNQTFDVFAYDRQAGITTRVSVDNAGNQANGMSSNSVDISGDGNIVAFESRATNLVAGDTSNDFEAFLHDRQTGITERVALASDGTPGTSGGSAPVLSSDGRYVAFHSRANNLVPGDTNIGYDIFVRDRLLSITSRVNLGPGGGEANHDSVYADISADGRYVAYWSLASNLVLYDTNNRPDVFLRDRQLASTVRVSLSSAGVQANGDSSNPDVSDDGKLVAFTSGADNLVSGDTFFVNDVFVRYVLTSLTVRASALPGGPQGNSNSAAGPLTNNGFVTMYSDADNLVAGDTNLAGDVFLRELTDDSDGDGTVDAQDNCGAVSNPGQQNDDADALGNACDNCPSVSNQDQADADGDGNGNACDDGDGDGVLDIFDNCAGTPNPAQENSDSDTAGDACDNCPSVTNPAQTNTDGDAMGDVCDPDDDNDGVLDAGDNCPLVANPSQADSDQDGVGDACDPPCSASGACVTIVPAAPSSMDFVRIQVRGEMPNSCHSVFSSHSQNGTTISLTVQVLYTAPPGTVCTEVPVSFTDTEDIGVLPEGSYQVNLSYHHPWCNPNPCTQSVPFTVAQDGDGDGVVDPSDNCPTVTNANQTNADGDSMGDACDPNDDNDMLADTAEASCGSDALAAASLPERLDGPFAAVDDDGDTQIDEALPGGASDFDCDGDGFKGSAEDHVYSYLSQTDGDQKTCQEYDATFPNPTHEPSLRWPADLNGSAFSLNKVNINDLAAFINPLRYLNQDVGTDPMDVRFDLVPGSTVGAEINIVDLAAITSGASGLPPMLGGAKAFGGPLCPTPP